MGPIGHVIYSRHPLRFLFLPLLFASLFRPVASDENNMADTFFLVVATAVLSASDFLTISPAE